ncbi:transglycosylase SLT domain-containing protein [Nocardia alni]|uniref:transglycosylase SLT domain-containing protein n=1 Tax=Nocardia alni TaxID=2815723 RepID=UPI0020B43C5D|nr:transglycosylase SLT domain-containing protein [Nocardia alni]
MPLTRNIPDPDSDDDQAVPGAHPEVTTAPSPQRRSAPKRPRLTPLELTTAAPPPATTAATKGVAAVTPAAAAALPLSGALAGQASATPLAATALGTLAMMAASYGAGAPVSDIGQSVTPPGLATSGQPAGLSAWDGPVGSGYASAAQTTSESGTAMGDVNTELTSLLSGAAGNTAQGRAAMQAILADVDSSITALGTVPDSAAGRALLIGVMDTALHRAGTVLGQGHSVSAITADRISALADRYLRESSIRSYPTAVYSGFSAGPPLAMPSGTEAEWIGGALDLLRANGYDVSHINPADIAAIIQHESGGNPNAINGWDSNAAAGHPSKGLMQTIDSTFYAHALPGHTNIWNPVDNIVAGVRYAIGRYGSVDNVPGIVRLHEGLSYVGY